MLLPSCISLAPDKALPDTVTEIPDSYGNGTTDRAYEPKAWWSAFEDPMLDALVEEAMRDNLDIAASAARLEQVRAQARVARAALYPTLDASGASSYSDSPLAGTGFDGFGPGDGGAAGFPALDRLVIENYTLSLAAGYEIDLFGRIRNDAAAALRDTLAARYDYRAIQLSTAAEVISAYFDIVDARRQIALSESTIDVLAERTVQTEDRFNQGLVDSLELYQIRQDFRNVQSALPQRQALLTSNEGRLALLLRDYPAAMHERLDQPLTPRLVFAPVPMGMPMELLSQRPDVASAWFRMEAARLRVGARKAERFPRLSLSGSVGTQGGNISGAFDVIDNWVLSLGANLTAPIFQGGRIKANIAAAEASYAEATANYAQSVLNAFREVVAALETYEKNRERYALIVSQRAEAEASLAVQQRRFSAGIGNYVSYLDALRGLYQVDTSLSTAARDVAIARLDVHRALGGDWVMDNEVEPVPLVEIEKDPVRDDVADRDVIGDHEAKPKRSGDKAQ
ncbi:TolC family protein [Alterisphingorhabdus coralli]|uniref:TolC family protein n=1 Tax=Alterisphingorhabdus coralli TaxID=3071408 RepID=A0AA97F5M4_9SPHN|nr:TolC family protein [Parasphingorhabdus sp. SCSIO 66989]WOE73881.1 TolC family protein [Parasphingorhabdus sp. SCSIO 66989]